MINIWEVNETNKMVEQENLDVRTITIGIAEDADIMDIAKMLKERGLIADEKLFVVQEFLSAYHNEILPGIYDLSTNMTAEQMLEVMSTPVKETEDAASE